MQRSSDIALIFLRMIVAGDIDKAFDLYVDMAGKHHNVFTPAGFPALRDGMKEAHVKFPKKQFVVLHVIGEDDMGL